MKQKIKKILKKLGGGPLAPIFYVVWALLIWIHYSCFRIKWWLTGAPRPTAEQQRAICQNVTFVFKSFERQAMARRLYRNIQKYYPGVRVIIADDSKKPLTLAAPGLEVIQLPFNSGLSRGLNQALARVQTPFTVRLDDDELLTPYSDFHGHLQFLLSHPEADLVGTLHQDLPVRRHWKKGIEAYEAFSMSEAPRALKIPHKTKLDDRHVVLGKVPNIFIARTEGYRAVGYDDNIRMIDHHEFFYRAAGELVSVLATDCFVLHYHNMFDRRYQRYRMDVRGDSVYIRNKYAAASYLKGKK